MKPLTFSELRRRLCRWPLTKEELNIVTLLDAATCKIWRLSPREREVLDAVQRWPGASNRDIAWCLKLKLKTFRTHLYNARKKLK